VPVEFLGIAATNDGSELHPRTGAVLDKDYTVRLAHAHEDNGFDGVLFVYSTAMPETSQVAALVAAHVSRLKLLVAYRPNAAHPTFAARMFAALDQISDGRVMVHFITGGSDLEQQREGDFLPKDERYARTLEYIQVVKRAWTSRERFDHHGEHYTFTDFVSDVVPVQSPRPGVSFGGSSPAAYSVGGAEADMYCLWGEPLVHTAEQIESIKRAAREAGRVDLPRFQTGFRTILGPTEEMAWDRAHRMADKLTTRTTGNVAAWTSLHTVGTPENTGSKRLLEQAEKSERYDRALWTSTTKLTGGVGNSTALVGTPETIAATLLDYYDLGIEVFSSRGYDTLDDAVSFGKHVIPIVREEVAKRDRDRAKAEARQHEPKRESIVLDR